MTALSTHVLDTAAGLPAAGIPVSIDGGAPAATDADGRARLGEVGDGVHTLTFATGGDFFGDVVITFTVAGQERLHVPLLLSPYAYTVYRGS